MKIGFIECVVTNQTYTQIECTTGAQAEATKAVTVTVTNSFDTEITADCTGTCDFTHSAAETPTITDVVSPDIVSIIIAVGNYVTYSDS